jgi:hypothetical protein
MRAGDGSPDEMRYVARLSDRHALDAAAAEGMLAGRGVSGDSPPGQQALARMLEIAARPPDDEELSGVAATVAGFAGARHEARRRSRRRTGLTLASAVGAAAVIAGTASAGALPARLQEVVHVAFGAPAPHREASRGSQGHHLTSGPGFQQQSIPGAGLGQGHRGSPGTVRTPKPARRLGPSKPRPPAPARAQAPAPMTKHSKPKPGAEGAG